MDTHELIIFCLWIVSAVFDYAEFFYFLQLKEYRWDRLSDFFKTKQAKDLFFGYRIFWRAFIVVVFYTFIHNTVSIINMAMACLLIDLMYNLYMLKIRKIRRPTPTPKVLIMIATTIIVEFCLLALVYPSEMTVLLFIVRALILVPVAVTVAVGAYEIKAIYRYLAKQKMKKQKHLKVIVVTGSYGKTSTKEILNQILSKKFRVVCTPKNHNTSFSISSFVLNTNFSDKDICIVEVGAYKKGDVAYSAEIVMPSIGILTTIGPEHLALFGTMKAIQETKYELLQMLPADGLAISNSDNVYVRELLHTIKAPIKTFGLEDEFSPYCLLTDIEPKKDSLKVSYLFNHTHELTIQTSLVGTPQAYNLASALIVAEHLGMSHEELKEAAKHLSITDRMRIHSYGKATIIDDSYNSNPEGFKAALHVLSSFSSDMTKIVITRGMLELGQMSDELHESIAGEISFCADKLVLISRDYEQPIKKGLISKYKTELIVIDDFLELKAYIESLKQMNVVVLLENKIPQVAYQVLH